MTSISAERLCSGGSGERGGLATFRKDRFPSGGRKVFPDGKTNDQPLTAKDRVQEEIAGYLRHDGADIPEASMTSLHAIQVDDREAHTQAALALAGHPEVQLRIARLSMGDYLVDNRLLVERKFLPDLLNSIEDGRLFRQAHALVQSKQPSLIILEGTSAHLAGRKMRREAIQGALLTLSLGMGLPILRAADGRETACLILQAADLLQREPRGWIRRSWQPHGAKRRLQSLLLQSIPGIGPRMAARLLERFQTLQETLAAPESALEEVPGLGPIKAKRIRWLVSETPVPYRVE